MQSNVFIIDHANKLTELRRSHYDSEALFQTLLADHPAILGQAAGPDGRLLLVRREAPVPDSEGGAGRWSLDHLFLDTDGVPVLVEVKRATDTRNRREVVAQMLDYAANGAAYWRVEQIIEALPGSAADPEGADTRLTTFLGDKDPETFWKAVDANLRSRRLRMVFVADHIPPELRRIVEFHNEQMQPAEVLAIEVEQFVTADQVRLLTPKLIGATERAATAKAVQAPKPALSNAQWLADLAAGKGKAAELGARKALDWFQSQCFVLGMTSSQDSMFARLTRPDGKPAWPFFVRLSNGKLETSLQYLKECPAFADDASRLDILDRLKALPGLQITTTKATGWPAIPLADLERPEVWEGFKGIALDLKDRVTSVAATGELPS